MGQLENVFSWSKSRDEEFRDCKRKYFYDKYASWGGWDKRAPQEARLAYVLKNLKNRWAWKGETVHHVIEEVLKSLRRGQPVPFEKAADDLTQIMRRDWKNSKAGQYREEPKKTVGLFEHEYAVDVTDATWKKMHDTSVEALKHFYDSRLYAELMKEDPSRWLVIEDLEEFDFEGSKIFVKLDFAREKNGAVEIYDWKTGKTNGDATIQMGAYAIYAMQKWGKPLDQIRGILFNLTSEKAEGEEQKLTPTLIEEAKDFMRKSIAEMRSLLQDPNKNVPKDRSFFPYTENPKLCDSCNFYRMCEKFKSMRK